MIKNHKSKIINLKSAIILLFAICIAACNPEAVWETENVELNMEVLTTSAGFVEVRCTTDKEAYYLLAIQEADLSYDPLAHQKQFMMLALDSANLAYLSWRNKLLKEGEFNIAPFSSHSLQYGNVTHFFTCLKPLTEYWVYAFVVNPVTMEPVGPLHIIWLSTHSESRIDVHFAYRVKGLWDYTYPLDSLGNINSHFPYIATTRDSLDIASEYSDLEAMLYFADWIAEQFDTPGDANVLYGLKAVENDGMQSSVMFEQGHTYYTAIAGYDGLYEHMVIYKFNWTGESCNIYMDEADSAHVVFQFYANE